MDLVRRTGPHARVCMMILAPKELQLILGFRIKLGSGLRPDVKPGLGFSLAVKLGSGDFF